MESTVSETTGQKLTEQFEMFDDDHSDLGNGEKKCSKCNIPQQIWWSAKLFREKQMGERPCRT